MEVMRELCPDAAHGMICMDIHRALAAKKTISITSTHKLLRGLVFNKQIVRDRLSRYSIAPIPAAPLPIIDVE